MNEEIIILVFNEDDDIIMAVRPDDPLNPSFTEDAIRQFGHDTSSHIVNSYADFLEWK